VEHKLPKTADHVQVSAQARESQDEAAIVVTLTVAKGYHVSANPANFDYLIPTTVSFEGISAARITYLDPVLFKPLFTHQALKVYEGSPAITATFQRGAFDNRSVIRGTVKVQACNDQICLPPSELEISAAMRLAPLSNDRRQKRSASRRFFRESHGAVVYFGCATILM